jgi:hypothetical protein
MEKSEIEVVRDILNKGCLEVYSPSDPCEICPLNNTYCGISDDSTRSQDKASDYLMDKTKEKVDKWMKMK